MGKFLNWKHSSLRFYWKNLIWNYNFWLHAKPVYGTRKYKVPKEKIEDRLIKDFDYYYDTFQQEYEYKEVKRFLGYQYKDKIYLDNMGMEGIDEETWRAWIKKGLIQV